MLALFAILLLAQAPEPEPEPEGLANLELSLTRHQRNRYAADLAEVKKRGVLRVLTRNNSSAYFIARGEERGFQYELAKAFADELGVRVQMVVPPSRSALIQALLDGEGDLIAAGMSYTPSRAEKVLYTRPVASVPRVIATHENIVKLLERPEDLLAFQIHLSFGSTTLGDARALEAKLGLPLRLSDVPDDVEMEDMLERVDSGEYEATIVDRHLLQLAQRAGVRVAERMEVSAPVEKAWAVHPNASALREAANTFLDRSGKNGLLRILYQRYFEPPPKKASERRDKTFRADVDGRISIYDDLFKEAGQATGLDWRLIAAVAHTESRFDPDAKSAFGAVGLMQLLPATAKEMGVSDPEPPKQNIKAGARYLRRLLKLFDEPGLDERQRVRFAVASYNAGPGHIRDARDLAKMTGKNPNEWFGQVEQAMKLKKDKRWAEKTRLGYARADETIDYVSRVQAQYDVYARHVEL